MINRGVSLLVIVACSTLGIVALTNYLASEQSAYAVDNCDSSSNCTNTQKGIDNAQTNNCRDSSTCSNIALGDRNTQTNRCKSAAGTEFVGGWDTIAGGNDNTLTINCTDSTCFNFAIGDGNTQILNCKSAPVDEFGTGAGCGQFAFGDDNYQKILCTNANPGNICGGNLAEGGNNNDQQINCNRVTERGGCANVVGGGENITKR